MVIGLDHLATLIIKRTDYFTYEVKYEEGKKKGTSIFLKTRSDPLVPLPFVLLRPNDLRSKILIGTDG